MPLNLGLELQNGHEKAMKRAGKGPGARATGALHASRRGRRCGANAPPHAKEAEKHRGGGRDSSKDP